MALHYKDLQMILKRKQGLLQGMVVLSVVEENGRVNACIEIGTFSEEVKRMSTRNFDLCECTHIRGKHKKHEKKCRKCDCEGFSRKIRFDNNVAKTT